MYADLGYADSASMLVKAELAAKIGEIIERRADATGWARCAPGHAVTAEALKTARLQFCRT